MTNEMSSLPSGWRALPLSSLGLWRGGGTPSKANPKFWQGTIPWVSPKDMKTFSIHDSEDHISEEAVQGSATTVIAQNSVLMVVRSGILSRTLPIAINRIPVALNQDLKACSPSVGIAADYLAWALRRFGKEILSGCQKDGTTVASIEFARLKRFEIPLGPLLEQRRIVAKLEELFSELDAGVAALRRAQRRLARYRQALLQAAVTGELTREWRGQQTHDIKLGKLDIEPPAWLPLGWDWTTLGEASEVTGGLTKNQRRPALPRQVPYLRVANVYADELRLEEVEKIGILEGELRRALLQKEDLLIVEGNGSLDQIGRVAIWDGSIDPCVHQNHIIKARLSERVLPRFALLWLLSPLGRDAIVEQASSTSGLHTLSISKVSGLPLPIPPIQEQQAIVAEYDRRNSLADALRATTQASLRRAERLRQSILERAFRGELVPQDPSDEPAEALLARLRASGTEAPAPRRRGRLPKAEPAEPQPSRRRGRPRKDAEA